jgi:hypothetical protein
MPLITKREWFGQETLPTVGEDVNAWAQLNHCSSRTMTTTPWGRQIDWVGCLNDITCGTSGPAADLLDGIKHILTDPRLP